MSCWYPLLSRILGGLSLGGQVVMEVERKAGRPHHLRRAYMYRGSRIVPWRASCERVIIDGPYAVELSMTGILVLSVCVDEPDGETRGMAVS